MGLQRVYVPSHIMVFCDACGDELHGRVAYDPRDGKHYHRPWCDLLVTISDSLLGKPYERAVVDVHDVRARMPSKNITIDTKIA